MHPESTRHCYAVLPLEGHIMHSTLSVCLSVRRGLCNGRKKTLNFVERILQPIGERLFYTAHTQNAP